MKTKFYMCNEIFYCRNCFCVLWWCKTIQIFLRGLVMFVVFCFYCFYQEQASSNCCKTFASFIYTHFVYMKSMYYLQIYNFTILILLFCYWCLIFVSSSFKHCSLLQFMRLCFLWAVKKLKKIRKWKNWLEGERATN